MQPLPELSPFPTNVIKHLIIRTALDQPQNHDQDLHPKFYASWLPAAVKTINLFSSIRHLVLDINIKFFTFPDLTRFDFSLLSFLRTSLSIQRTDMYVHTGRLPSALTLAHLLSSMENDESIVRLIKLAQTSRVTIIVTTRHIDHSRYSVTRLGGHKLEDCVSDLSILIYDERFSVQHTYCHHLPPLMVFNGEPRSLWFIVHEDSAQVDPAKVAAFSDQDIDDIKKLINVQRQDIPASEMLLWKVNISISITRRTVEETNAFTKRINGIHLPDRNSPNAYEGGDVQLLDGSEPVSSYWKVNPPKGLHIIVQRLSVGRRLKRRRVEIEDEGWKDRRLPSEAILQGYNNMFQHVSDDPQWYSNPQNCHSIPFPFSFSEPPERFSVQDGKFEYMGRESFRKVHEIVSSLKPGGGGTRLYIQGSMGFGKSHILAALACLLYRQRKVVVFIPDVRAMLLAPVPYVKTALLCTFAGPSFEEERKRIRACGSMNDISSFYHGLNFFPYLIVDQINAFELSDLNTNSVSRETKDACRIFINDLSVGSFLITSASANYQTAMHMEKKQTNETKLPLMGGMSPEEMEQWWHHHKDRLPKFENDEECVEVEELTGRIPLLLRPLLRFSQQKYRAVDFWGCPEIAAVRRNIKEFSDSKRKIGEREYNDYLEALCSCITRGGISEHTRDSFDYRYFYPEGRCDYTCGLAREAATSVITKRKHGKFYEAEWINTLRFYKNNPSALGIQVELICLACITDMGLNFGDVHIKPKVPVNFVGNLNNLLDIIPSNPRRGFSQLYLPENPRFEDMDGAYVEYDHRSNTVHVVPMQVTINGRHKDSEALFYNKWAKWKSKFSEYELTSTFAWIVESEIYWAEIVEQTRQTRQTTQMITPEHRQAVIPLVNVHEPLAKELARIRKGTPSDSFGGVSTLNPPNQVAQTLMKAAANRR